MNARTVAGIGALIAVFSCALTSGFAQRRISDEDKEKNRIRLGITKEQEVQIEGIWKSAGDQERELRKKEMGLYMQLHDITDIYDFDRNQASAVRREIYQLFKQRLTIHAETQEKIRRVVTKEQFDRMTALAKEMHEK